MSDELGALLRAAELALLPVFGEVRLRDAERLVGSERAVVARAALDGPPGSPPTVVVKTHGGAEAAEAAVREAAALTLLSGLGVPVAPPLLATASDPELLVLGDLGGTGSLADRLLADDAGAAAAGLVSWAEALGALQAVSTTAPGGAGAAFAGAAGVQSLRLGAPEVATDDSPAMIEGAIARLTERLPAIGVQPPAEALDELRSVSSLLLGDGPAAALTPADACPDNNILGPAGATLLDFEGASVRHAAWDAAYLFVPWPSCWCCWALPEPVARTAYERWQSVAGDAIPYVRTQAFETDLAIGRVTWAAISLAWFLPQAVGTGEAREPRTPPARALVQHRLAGAAGDAAAGLPAVSRLCREVLAAAKVAWGEVPLPLAPAFRGG